MTDRERELEAEVAALRDASQLDQGEIVRLKKALEDQALATERGRELVGPWIVEAQKLKVETTRLKDLCLRAAFYIGVRQGPEVDEEADELLRCLRGET